MAAPASANRLVCARCGANNFDTQAACWKCGAPLGVGGAAPAASAPSAAASQFAAAPAHPSPARASDVPVSRPLAAPVAAAVRPQPGVDPAVANWTAIISSLLMPGIMFPVGVVFLMLDDRRKLEVGRITLIASTVGTALHLFFTFLLLGSTLSAFINAGPGMVNWAQKLKEAQAGRSQDLSQPAPPLDLPGQRPLGGQQPTIRIQ